MTPNLPIYRLALNDDLDSGVDYIALVDDPAIQRQFMAFKSQSPPRLQFLATNTDQQIVSGPLMVADMCIFRDDPIHGKHLVYFDAQTIKQIILRFFQKGLTSNINLMHIPDAKPDGIYMFESFIIDSSKGITTPKGFEALPDGSWFGSFKIDNADVWNHFIKTGEFKGFSVEGFFSYQPEISKEEMSEGIAMQQVKEIMNLIEKVA
jgi:hypothetical protein